MVSTRRTGAWHPLTRYRALSLARPWWYVVFTACMLGLAWCGNGAVALKRKGDEYAALPVANAGRPDDVPISPRRSNSESS